VLINEKKNWNDAKDHCETLGGVLAAISTAAQNEEIASLFATTGSERRLWLGGWNPIPGSLDVDDWVWTRKGGECGYERYKRWSDGEPNDMGGIEGCMFMYKDNKNWYDGNCATKFPFVCMDIGFPPPAPPSPPPPMAPEVALTLATGVSSVSLGQAIVATAVGTSASMVATLTLAADGGASMEIPTTTTSGMTCTSAAADRVSGASSYSSKVTCTTMGMADMANGIGSMVIPVWPACPGRTVHLATTLDASDPVASAYGFIRSTSSTAYTKGTITIPLSVPFPEDTKRTVLGRAIPSDALGTTAPKGWCERDPIEATLTSTISYATLPNSFGGDCTYISSSDTAIDAATGRFAYQVHLPAARDKAGLTISPRGSADFASVVAYLDSQTATDSWDTDLLLVPSLWLIPASRPTAAPISGTVVAAKTSLASGLTDAISAGTVKVSVYSGVDHPGPAYHTGSQPFYATVAADGTFALPSGLSPGMYTLHVTSTQADLKLAGASLSVRHDATAVVIEVFVKAASGASDWDTHALVSYDPLSSADSVAMDLHLKFDISGTSYDVSPASKSVAGATWDGAITMTSSTWVPGSTYSFFADYRQSACNGYSKASSAELPGGTSTTVDCRGDCVTGKGYCYSSGDGAYCASCVLHSPAAGEELCSDHGFAQGDAAQLPGGSAFGASCQANYDSTAAAMPCSTRAMESEPTLRLFAGGKLVQRVPIPSATLQEGAGGPRALWFLCIEAQQCSGCTQVASAPSVRPSIQLGSRPGLGVAEYDLLGQGTLAAADMCSGRALSAVGWSCDAAACVVTSSYF